MNDAADIDARRQVLSQWLSRLLPDGDIAALFCAQMSPNPENPFRCNAIGYFNDRNKAAEAALYLDGYFGADAVYVNLNAVNPALLARGVNEVKHKQRATVTDSDIQCRRNLLIDLDPVRPTGVSSTDREMNAAIERGNDIRDYVLGLGMPDSPLAMTGNGAALIPALDLPLSVETDKLIASLLAAIAGRFSDNVIEVDRTVGNRARWTKLIGTTARKGADSRGIAGLEDRPHRVSHVVHLPSVREAWTIDHLNALVASLTSGVACDNPKRRIAFDSTTSSPNEFVEVAPTAESVRAYLERFGVSITAEMPRADCTALCLEECPATGVTSQGQSDIAVLVYATGTIGYRNQHSRGAEVRWVDVRDALEPGFKHAHEKGAKGKKPSLVDALMSLMEGCEFFRTEGAVDEGVYATMPMGDHSETWPIGSGGFRTMLEHRCFRQLGRAPMPKQLDEAIGVMRGKAKFDGQVRTVALRVGGYGESIYVDLCDDKWRQVRISGAGWEVINSESSPVRFWRSEGMLPLPEPRRGEPLHAIRYLFNVADDHQWTMLAAWMLGAIRPSGPYPVLCMTGEQGSSKTTCCRLARMMVDPHRVPIRRLRAEDDLLLTARNSHVLSFDNLSSIKPDLSDAVCSVATGVGFAKRRLYSDYEEAMGQVCRPVILNGITDFTNRSDLMDRAIVLRLPKITPSDRREESDIMYEFGVFQPFALGALFDAAASAIRNKHAIRLLKKPRMADFAAFVAASEPVIGWPANQFISAYESNIERVRRANIDGCAEGALILRLMQNHPNGWKGTAAQLLAALKQLCYGDLSEYRRQLPDHPRGMGGRLRLLARDFEACGLYVDEASIGGGNTRQDAFRIQFMGAPSGAPA